MIKQTASFHGMFLLTAVVFMAILWIVSSCTRNGQDPVSAGSDNGVPLLTSGTGNGVPSGPHYDLNIIGVPQNKTADMSGDNGHRIFVSLSGNTKIMLSPGPFQVLDANGTDGSAAFQLPNPDSANSGATAYSVFARALGKPGGSSVTHTCGTDSTGTTFCSTDSLLLVRSKGKSSFVNVSKDLLYIYADINGDGVIDRIPLFDSSLQGYFWNYDNNGLKLVQLRFYDISTTVQ